MKKTKILVLIFVVALIAAFFIFDLGKYFSLEYFKQQQGVMAAYYQANPLQTGLLFFAAYIAVTALSLPGAAIMTLVPAPSLASSGVSSSFRLPRVLAPHWLFWLRAFCCAIPSRRSLATN